jgi:hypothetical protein
LLAIHYWLITHNLYRWRMIRSHQGCQNLRFWNKPIPTWRYLIWNPIFYGNGLAIQLGYLKSYFLWNVLVVQLGC